MKTEKAIIWYVILVALISLGAFLSNPLNAWSALISGVCLVVLSLGIRQVMKKNPDLGRWLLLALMVLVILGLGFRVLTVWYSLFEGNGPIIIKATSMTAIVLLSVWLLTNLWKGKKVEQV